MGAGIASIQSTITAETTSFFEKAIIMKPPGNRELRQEGEFSFLYTPKNGFKGRDNFVIYICGSDRGGSGCARLNYQATIR